ncbi:MAG: PD-(D/E)XK nuclease family protein [Acidimicrobiales bacterium]
MTTRIANPPRGPSIAFPADSPPLLRLSAHVTSEGYDAWRPIDDQMDEHERLRLLYVAATRARDHLVVCLHRLTGNVRTSASVLADPGLTSSVGTRFAAPFTRAPSIRRPTPQPLPDRASWHVERTAALAAASARRVIAATTLASTAHAAAADPDPGLDKRARDLDLPPWQKGRYGTAVGRAVHGVLQVVDLATGAGLDEAARAQAAAEGVANRTAVVARLARAGVESTVARAAAAAPHWRELWVAAPVGDHLIEGYVDLLYRDADGLVVVDWKTDHVGDADGDPAAAAAALDAKVQRYRLQGASYAAAVEAVTGEPVVRVVFAFLGDGGATLVELPELRAVDEVRSRTAELALLAGHGGSDTDTA